MQSIIKDTLLTVFQKTIKIVNIKKISYLVLISIIVAFGQLNAQMQTAHWYFGGNAGLDFTSGGPVIDTNGQINTIEGCASISDEYGSLLFYTDGRYVYDNTHNQMLNGWGLRGDESSTSSAVILPKPDDCNLYYVFTIDCRDENVPSYRPKRGMEYNIVDMSLNGGLGAVVEKNISMPINGEVQGYEKLAVISNANKTGYWVITHFEGNFYAFEVTLDGVNINPVVSSSSVYGGSQNIGYLKGSSNGSKLAMGMYFSNCSDRYLSVYNFNNSTGVVNNEIILHQPGDDEPSNYYGVEFSPNSQLLYATNVKPNCNNGDYQNSVIEIVQYNLMVSTVVDSKYVVAENAYYGALQVGLDGKIYNSGGGIYIGSIVNPNIAYNSSTGESPV